MRKRGTSRRLVSVCLPVCLSVRVSVCLSVYLSHSCILSIRLKMSSNFYQLGSPIILVFEPKRRYTIPKGIPSIEALNKGWVGKFAISRYILETVQDRPIFDRPIFAVEHQVIGTR